MSQFQSGRNRAPQTPQIGTRRSLAAPGLEPTPPVSIGARKSEALAQALGIAGTVADSARQVTDAELSRRKRQEAENAQLYRGQAALDAKAALPEILQKIEDRELLVPDGEKVEDYARQYLDEKLAESDLPEPYADQYRQMALPTLAKAWTDQQGQIIEQAQEENLQLAAEAATVASDGDSVREAIDTARRTAPDLSESEILDRVVTPALRTAAVTGDAQRFEAAAEALGNRFPGLVKSLRTDLKATIRSRQARDDRDRDQAVHDRVGDELARETPNYDHLADWLKKQPVSGQTRYGLEQQISAARQHDELTRQREIEKQLVEIEGGRPDVADYRKQVAEIAPEQAESLTDAYLRDRIEQAAQTGNVEMLDQLSDEASDEPAMQTFLAEQRQGAIGRRRNRRSSRLIAGVLSGDIKRSDALAAAQGGARRYAADPDDPDAFHPAQVQQIESAAAQKGSMDQAARQVASRLQTGSGVLTESQHASALDEAMVAAGHLDQANRIQNPEALAGSVIQAGITSRGLRETLAAHLTGSDTEQAVAAAKTIGLVADGRPRLFADMLDKAGDEMRPVLEEVRFQWEAGRLQDEQTRGAALESVRGLMDLDFSKPDPGVVEALQRQDIDLTEEATGIAQEAVGAVPWADDWWMDPSQDVIPEEVTGQVSRWYSQHFSALRRNRAMPFEAARARAKSYARDKFEQRYDVVRWFEQLTVVPVEQRNVRLTDDLRWSAGMDDEAWNDLQTAIDAGDLPKDFDRDRVQGFRPYLSPTDPDERGWLFIDEAGHALTTDGGELLIFQPSTAQRHRNQQYRELLEKKEAAYGQDYELDAHFPLVNLLIGP